MQCDRSVCVFALVCVLASARAQRGYERGDNSGQWYRPHPTLCTKAQSTIDLIELMGLWNVIEVIEHNERFRDHRNYLRSDGRTAFCPTVHFAQDDDRSIRMIWNEQDGYIVYLFRLTNVKNPGFWMSVGYQSGTMVDNNYEHFAGTGQVMKAVQSHMVLTFCSPHDRHFSIILAREKYLSYEEVKGVHKQLNRVNLPLMAVQSYCRNAAGILGSSALSLLISLIGLSLSARHLS